MRSCGPLPRRADAIAASASTKTSTSCGTSTTQRRADLAVSITPVIRIYACWTREPPAREELTLDYALFSVAPEWRMECHCGSSLCRGVVTGNDWRLLELQERYAGHFSPFINARIA